MTTKNETDMRSFEGALDERWCHIARSEDGPNYCGTSRSGPLHSGTFLTERCSGCGLRNCPDCVRMSVETEGPL